MIADFFQFLGDSSIEFVAFVLSLLPSAPDFTGSLESFVNSDMENAFGVLNWFVPVSGIVSLLSAWLLACVSYIVIRWAVNTFGGKG